MKTSLRGRFIGIAHQVQGEQLPVYFRESPTPNMAVLAPMFVRWAAAYHGLTKLAVLDRRIWRLSQCLKRTSINSALP